MAQRPYWTGQIRLSLVTLPVELFSAVKRSASQIDLDQIDRKSGERVHHMNVLENGKEVSRENIIKGYQVFKGDYVLLEPEEIEQVKLPSSDVFELTHFIDQDKLPLTHIEKPYYALPKGKNAIEIYGVFRDALKATGKVGLGQITLRGKEELCALIPYEKGLLVQTLRYSMEVRDPDEYYGDISSGKTKGEYLSLAKKLIEENSAEPSILDDYTDHYFEALMELIHSKEENRKPEYKTAEKAPDKVIDLMEALRKSLKGGKTSTKKKTATGSKTTKRKSTGARRTPARKSVSKRKRA
ncbi:MAG: Ku protein [Rickettsiales bacterium]